VSDLARELVWPRTLQIAITRKTDIHNRVKSRINSNSRESGAITHCFRPVGLTARVEKCGNGSSSLICRAQSSTRICAGGSVRPRSLSASRGSIALIVQTEGESICECSGSSRLHHWYFRLH
jgi:hypothetical protein